MANTSIMFNGPLTNSHLFGLVMNLNTYSSVNHAIQIASIIISSGLSVGFPCSGSGIWNSGSVLSVSAMVDIMMNEMLMAATTFYSDVDHFVMDKNLKKKKIKINDKK